MKLALLKKGWLIQRCSQLLNSSALIGCGSQFWLTGQKDDKKKYMLQKPSWDSLLKGNFIPCLLLMEILKYLEMAFKQRLRERMWSRGKQAAAQLYGVTCWAEAAREQQSSLGGTRTESQSFAPQAQLPLHLPGYTEPETATKISVFSNVKNNLLTLGILLQGYCIEYIC